MDAARYSLDRHDVARIRAPNMMYEWKGHKWPVKGWRYVRRDNGTG